VLNWRRTSNDPFAGQWEQIPTWIQANPTRSSGDIFRELQSLSPGGYEGSHLLQTQEEEGSSARRGEQRLFPAKHMICPPSRSKNVIHVLHLQGASDSNECGEAMSNRLRRSSVI